MALDMKENSGTTRLMDWEGSFTITVTSMKENSEMTKLMVREHTGIALGLNIQDAGEMIRRMALAERTGMTVPTMRDTSKVV